jgi:tetratricopeptide (TPR) repeat protein
MMDPDLNPQTEHRSEYRQQAIKLFRRAVTIRESLIRVDPENQSWLADLAYQRIVLGTLEQENGDVQHGAELAAIGTAALHKCTVPADVSIHILDLATAASQIVLPAFLRDTALTVHNAERLVALTHHHRANFLLTLAQAYRANGQFEKAAATAPEGLALLAPLSPGGAIFRNRKLLQREVERSESQPRPR